MAASFDMVGELGGISAIPLTRAGCRRCERGHQARGGLSRRGVTAADHA
eukprot:CAMPEP_0184382138 /NCGR_PEP_ID=MMETSP0007-20130409/6096_1 /TAXON_ID=97485 /ORGANISM="Prymnesium parvum, Strain Texoma1" /LENGTH=48 /DNA_ID= /DNA_START= /DNA_END= /DNA_ORIENTATION=